MQLPICLSGPIYLGYIPFHAAESKDLFLVHWVLFVKEFLKKSRLRIFLPWAQRISQLLNRTWIAGFESKLASDCARRFRQARMLLSFI